MSHQQSSPCGLSDPASGPLRCVRTVLRWEWTQVRGRGISGETGLGSTDSPFGPSSQGRRVGERREGAEIKPR